MSKKRSQLARRPHAPDELASRVIYHAGEAAAEYVVSRTALGDFAMHWTADWLSGMFSITDLPPEWVAFAQSSLGGFREAVYVGEPVAFSTVLWDLKPFDDPAIAFQFCDVLLDGADLPGPFGVILDAVRSPDIRTWRKGKSRLPFGGRPALPGPGETTV